jgi:hypothetical protein
MRDAAASVLFLSPSLVLFGLLALYAPGTLIVMALTMCVLLVTGLFVK